MASVAVLAVLGLLVADHFEPVSHLTLGLAALTIVLSTAGALSTHLLRVAAEHHERWDGRGYPDGLVADGSPLEARILAAADSLDAMTTSRSYKAPLTARAARDEIAANAGSQFDPVIAAVVVELIDEGLFPLHPPEALRADLDGHAATRPESCGGRFIT